MLTATKYFYLKDRLFENEPLKAACYFHDREILVIAFGVTEQTRSEVRMTVQSARDLVAAIQETLGDLALHDAPALTEPEAT